MPYAPRAAVSEGFLSPHRRRWIILALIFCAIVLNYFDRQIVSILKPTLKAEFRLDDAGYALLANIFTVCYACMYPGGRLARRNLEQRIPASIGPAW